MEMQKPPRYEVYKEAGLFWWRLMVGHLLITKSPVGYTEAEACERSIENVKRFAGSDIIRMPAE